MSRIILVALALLALVVSACGGEDEPTASSTPKARPAAAQSADLGAIKAYLLDHTQRLVTSVGTLNTDAQAYYDLAKSTDFDYAELLKTKRAEVEAAVTKLQEDHIKANPDYEEMEGVVAGVPELADFDVIIDAGSDGSDPGERGPVQLQDRGRARVQAARQLLRARGDVRVRHRAEVRGQGRGARPGRRRQGRVPRGAARRAVHARRLDRVRQVRARSSTRPRRRGSRRWRTRSPPWS